MQMIFMLCLKRAWGRTSKATELSPEEGTCFLLRECLSKASYHLLFPTRLHFSTINCHIRLWFSNLCSTESIRFRSPGLHFCGVKTDRYERNVNRCSLNQWAWQMVCSVDISLAIQRIIVKEWTAFAYFADPLGIVLAQCQDIIAATTQWQVTVIPT